MPAKKPTDFKNDEVVWVKLGSYPWWPARVAEKDGTLYKGKKVHVIFFGDDTEAWCDVNKMKSPFLDHVEAHGKNKRVVAAVEQAHVWLSQSAANGTGGDDRDVEPDMADADADDMTAPIAAVTGDEEQAASAKTTTEAGSESGESIPPPMSTDGAKQTEQLGDGGGDDAGTGGDEDEDEDEDEQDDGSGGDDEDDDDSELSLSEGSDDDGPAFEPKSRKSSKPAAKRKAAARGAPSAKRSRSNGGAARRVQKEKEHDDPVPEVELRDAPLTELASLRAQADEGISAFAEASTVVDSLSASRLKLEAKLDKVKKQEKQAAKLQQDAKAKIRKALKDVAGCKMTVTALKETKWGRTVKKLSKFEGDANISKVADAQMNRWKASVSVESDASVASAETQEKQPQGADQGNPSPQPEAAAATDDSAQPEHPQQAESNDPRGNGQGAGTTVVPQKPAQTLAAPSGDAEAEAAATEKLRAKARNLLAEVLGLSPDCEPAVAEISKEAVIARELEAELFRIHGQPQSMAYKMRFRTLKLALKENESLRQALLTGETTAAAVAVDETLHQTI